MEASQEDALAQLCAFLGEQDVLLVMDNFEQLVDDGTAVVLDLLERLPRLGKPLPADAKDAPADHVHPRIAEINERLAKLEADEVTFLDFGPKFLDGEGRLLQKWMPDFLHLSPEGYALFAKALREPVEDLLSGKPTAKARAKAATRRVDALRGQLMMWVSAAPR